MASAVMQNEEDCEEPPSSVSAIHNGGNSQRIMSHSALCRLA